MASRLEAELQELVLALIMFLAGLGYAVSGLPANIVIGCVIWGIAWIFVTHLFFVSDSTTSCPVDVKVILWGAVTCLVVLALWTPVRTEYAKEHMPSASPIPKSPHQVQFPPTPSTPRSYMVFDGAPYFVQYTDEKGRTVPDQNLRIGQPLIFNFNYKQVGPNPVEFMRLWKWLYVEPDVEASTQKQMIDDFNRRVHAEHVAVKTTTTFTQGRSGFNTAGAAEDIHVRTVTEDELKALRSGTEIAFVIAQIAYEDNAERHHARMCYYLQPPAYFPGVWHECIGFNHSD